MKKDLLLAEMISARFTHEIAGPLGAIISGLDFLNSSDEEMKKKAFELAQDSALQSIARLQFYRHAYGIIYEDNQANLSRLKELVDNFFAKTKIHVNWQIHDTDYSWVNTTQGKIIINLILLCSQTLILGGEINVDVELINKKPSITIKGDGEAIKVNEEVEKILLNKINIKDIQVKDAHAMYTMHLINNYSAKLNWQTGNKFIKFLLSYG
jgi:histidine phosphotransferase ChpT